MINIDYEHAIDFEHCENLEVARKRLSQITNLLNKVIAIRHGAKNQIIMECAKYPDMCKLSWENKVIELLFLSGRAEATIDLIQTYNKSDEAYQILRNKQAQVVEDTMALKKIMEVTPR